MEEIDFGRMDFDYATLDENVRQRMVDEEDDEKDKCKCRSNHSKGLHDSDAMCLDSLLLMIRKRYDAGYTWCETSFIRSKYGVENIDMFYEDGLCFLEPRGKIIEYDANVMEKWQFHSSIINRAIEEVQVLGLSYAKMDSFAKRIDFNCPPKKQMLGKDSIEYCCKWIPMLFLSSLCIILFSLFIMQAGKNNNLPDCHDIEAHTFCRGSVKHTSSPFPCRLTDMKSFLHMVNLSKV